MRKEFELTDEEFKTLLDKMHDNPPLIMLQTGMPMSQQERANAAWEALGKEKGFKGMTVKPVAGKSAKFFTAEVAETENE